MSSSTPPPSPPQTPASESALPKTDSPSFAGLAGTALGDVLTAFAAANNTTPIALLQALIAPFEERMADNISNAVVSKIINTAAIGKQIDALQNDFDKPAGS